MLTERGRTLTVLREHNGTHSRTLIVRTECIQILMLLMEHSRSLNPTVKKETIYQRNWNRELEQTNQNAVPVEAPLLMTGTALYISHRSELLISNG